VAVHGLVCQRLYRTRSSLPTTPYRTASLDAIPPRRPHHPPDMPVTQADLYARPWNRCLCLLRPFSHTVCFCPLLWVCSSSLVFASSCPDSSLAHAMRCPAWSRFYLHYFWSQSCWNIVLLWHPLAPDIRYLTYLGPNRLGVRRYRYHSHDKRIDAFALTGMCED